MISWSLLACNMYSIKQRQASFLEFRYKWWQPCVNVSRLPFHTCQFYMSVDILLMSARLEPDVREYWIKQCPAPEYTKTKAYDAHFHLDRTMSTMNLHENSTLQEILDGIPWNMTRMWNWYEHVHLSVIPIPIHGLAIWRLYRLQWLLLLDIILSTVNRRKTQMFWMSVGQHFTAVEINQSGSCRWRRIRPFSPSRDMAWFHTVVDIDKVLLLHCWGMKEDSGTIYALCFDCLKSTTSNKQRLSLCFIMMYYYSCFDVLRHDDRTRSPVVRLLWSVSLRCWDCRKFSFSFRKECNKSMPLWKGPQKE